MKTAILLVGNIRTWDYCKPNFIDTFNKYNPDIFLVIDNYRYGHHPAIQSRIGDNADEHIDESYVEKMFADLNLKNYAITARVSQNIQKICPNFLNMESTFSQVEKFKLCAGMLVQDYDCVIKTRCDLLYHSLDVDNLNLNESILVDSGNVFPNDCIVVTNKTNMINISNFMYQEMFTQKHPESHLNPPHGLLKTAADHHSLKIETRKIMDCAVRKGNKKEYY
jgi:hypothetical protein